MIVAALILALGGQAAETPVSTLLGRSLTEVADALGVAAPATETAFVLVEGGRAVSLYGGDAFRAPFPQGQRCATQLVTPDAEGRHDLSDFGANVSRDAAAMVAFQAVFVFENDRLVAVREPPRRDLSPTPAKESRRALMERFQQAGARSDWPVAPGRLPLSDGAAFADRPGGVAGSTVVATACQPRPVPSAPQERGFDEAGLIQGLALLPLAVTLPALNAERNRAGHQGPARFASALPGQALPGGAAAFVAGQRGVRLYRDPEDPDYGVIVISLGWDRRNNLGRYNDVAMVGIRGDDVVWTADAARVEALGLRTPMCLGVDGRLDQVRPGCSNSGYFTFGD